MTKMMVSRGAQHPHSVLSVENLGRLLQKQGNWSEAESYFRQALQLREETLGPTHPDTLLAANNLSSDPWNFADQSSLFLFLVFLRLSRHPKYFDHIFQPFTEGELPFAIRFWSPKTMLTAMHRFRRRLPCRAAWIVWRPRPPRWSPLRHCWWKGRRGWCFKAGMKDCNRYKLFVRSDDAICKNIHIYRID